MECPLRKRVRTTSSDKYSANNFSNGDGYEEDFLPCIEQNCAAWNDKEIICNYLQGKREIKLYF